MKKTSEAKLRANAKYDAGNTVQIHLKFNTKTDADILDWLDTRPKQTAIKEAIREKIARE